MRTKTWEKRDFIALLLVIFQFSVVSIFHWILPQTNEIVRIITTFGIGAISLALLLKMYGEILSESWQNFRKKLWLKVLISVVLAVVIVGALQGVRTILALLGLTGEIAANGSAEEVILPFAVSLVAAFMPLLAAVMEEIAFRHAFFYKHKNSKTAAVLLFVVSAFLFGAIHINNFGGNLILTIPYMAAGAIFNTIYLLGKNIWYPIFVHLVFNFVLAALPTLIMAFVRLLV